MRRLGAAADAFFTVAVTALPTPGASVVGPAKEAAVEPFTFTAMFPAVVLRPAAIALSCQRASVVPVPAPMTRVPATVSPRALRAFMTATSRPPPGGGLSGLRSGTDLVDREGRTTDGGSSVLGLLLRSARREVVGHGRGHGLGAVERRVEGPGVRAAVGERGVRGRSRGDRQIAAEGSCV